MRVFFIVRPEFGKQHEMHRKQNPHHVGKPICKVQVARRKEVKNISVEFNNTHIFNDSKISVDSQKSDWQLNMRE